jgi:hypothetical protein
MSESCETCKFWLLNELYEVPTDDTPLGACRRHPPSVYAANEGDDQGNPECPDCWVYPATFEYQWCGEYQPQSPQATDKAIVVREVEVPPHLKKVQKTVIAGALARKDAESSTATDY